jgi:hypothetical protein
MLFSATLVSSQLSYKESFWGKKTYYDKNVKISKHDFKNILLKNPESEKLYNSYKGWKTTAYVVDAFAITSTIYYLNDPKKHQSFAYTGLSFALSAYLMEVYATGKLKKSIEVSNKGLGLSYRF